MGSEILENGKTDVLRVTYSPSRPVELSDFVRSCNAIASEYNSFAAWKGCDQCKLYVKEVRKGSIELDLVNACGIAFAVQQVMPFVEGVNVMSDFIGHVRSVIDWLKSGNARAEDNRFAAKTLENVCAFLDPVAKDRDAKVTINAITVNGDVNAPLVVGNSDANYVQNAKRIVDEGNSTPNVRRVEGVMLKWYQSRNSVEPSGDKAIIDSVSPKPLRTVFVDQKMKSLLLSVSENIFKCAWLVTVIVESFDGVPKLYRIESIEKLPD